MISVGSIIPTCRARIVVPSLIAYGLGLYLVVGAVGDALSSPASGNDAGIVAEPPLEGPAASRASVDQAALNDAVEAAEGTKVIRDLVRGQNVTAVRAGPWTAGGPGAEGPGPSSGTGVSLTVELPAPTSVDLSTLPGAEAAHSERSTAAAEPRVAEDVSALLVLYDPSMDEIAAVHPVPATAPAPPPDLGPSPEVARADEPGRGRGNEGPERARG